MDLKEFFITPDGFSDTDLAELGDARPSHSQTLEGEGQLAVDVYATKEAVIIKTAIAGVKPEDVQISLADEMLTIRGHRHQEDYITDEQYYFQECYWGSFSRSVVLPVEVDQEKIEAVFKNGVLTITLPKKHPERTVSVQVADED